MSKDYNFRIESGQAVSAKFLSLGLLDFKAACNYIKQLPYGRNKDKTNLLSVFDEACGTCGTKHALLKQLAIENNKNEVKLMMGIYAMNALNTPGVRKTLGKYTVNYIPEAHNYLRINNLLLDCTYAHTNNTAFVNDIMEEIELQPEQITSFKVAYHKQFLEKWLAKQALNYTLEQIWDIRESCIAELSGN